MLKTSGNKHGFMKTRGKSLRTLPTTETEEVKELREFNHISASNDFSNEASRANIPASEDAHRQYAPFARPDKLIPLEVANITEFMQKSCYFKVQYEGNENINFFQKERL
eukprot:snap_masked-scaffold_45-processed-gene-1.97-mRNA-1 protein AED:1.00 eAED:1.00 QI:0/-1/0/0/-1/1/1/0/109